MIFHISARDRAITRRVLQGESCRRVSQDYGLCWSRVRQITLETVHRRYPYHPGLTGLGLLRLRQHAWLLLLGLDLERQEDAG